MFSKKQKISHRKTYHQPSFSMWLKYNHYAKVVALVAFVLTFGSAGYAAVNFGSAAGDQVLTKNESDQTVAGLIEVKLVDIINLGNMATPFNIPWPGSYSFNFISTAPGYEFAYWQLSTGEIVTSQQLRFDSSQLGDRRVTLVVKIPAPPAPPAQPSSPSVPSTISTPTTNVKPKPKSPTKTAAPVTPPPDTTPPSSPADFRAEAKADGGLIDLSWTASTDNASVSHYELSRSTDGINWQTLADHQATTAFQDTTASFDVTYHYRIKAVDTSNNSSGFSTIETKLSSFKANVTPESGGSVSLSRKGVSITIPAQVIQKPASCSTTEINSVVKAEGPRINVSGPYQLICKTEDSQTITDFSQAVAVTIVLPDQVIRDFTDFKAYKLDGSRWAEADGQVQGATISFTTDANRPFAITGTPKHGSIWGVVIKLTLILLSIGGLAGSVLGLLYWRYRRQQQARYETYVRQQYGL